MNARRPAVALAVATLAGSGTYLFVYLYRWEWNRALIAGVFFLAAEVALGFAVVLRRLPDRPRAASPVVVERIRETGPPSRDHFAWLAPSSDRFSVFVPVLMGAGVVLSGIAWAVERLARWTARPVLERQLAGRLAVLGLSHDRLVPDPGPERSGLELLLGPRPGVRR
jgi:hypothetical protein